MIELGPFELWRPVGVGGMGQVWQGVHREQNIPVAVKILTSERARMAEYRAYFRNEVRAVAGLDHPHVVMVFDHGETTADTEEASEGRIAAGCPYLVMEWASEGTLAGRPPMGWPTLRGILLCLLDSLAHAHARGVVHRDLKPGNILVCGRGDMRPGLKLADFGIARPLDIVGVGEAAVVVGTPSYMAPEQASGRWRDQGPWTDLYGLGCLVYRLLTGAPPFPTTDTEAAMHAHLRVRPPALRPKFPMPRGFHEWTEQLMEKDPMRRVRRAADAAHALLQLEDPSATVTLPVPGVAPTPEAVTLMATVTLGPALWDDDLVTVAQESEGEEPSPSDVGRPAGRPRPAPPVPRQWRRQESAPASPRLLGAGLGLYGLRAIPLVDREPERDVLWGALRKTATDARARMVVLQGAAGCGKTRLAQWLCERAHEVGAATVLHAVHEEGRLADDGLGPMLARDTMSMGLDRAGLVRRLERIVKGHGVTTPSEWRGLAEVILPSPEGTPNAVRFAGSRERHVAIRRHLERLCAERPVVVALDDVQWNADALSFARHLLESQERSPQPILLLATVREDALAQQPAAAATLQELLERADVLRLSIGPLDPVHRPALVRELLGLEGDLAAQVEERTAGNPLFAVQLVGEWVQRGLLEPGDLGFRLKPGVEVELPDDLHAVWAARVAQFLAGRPHSEGAALEMAAVLGQKVNAQEWHEACAAAGFVVSPLLVEALISRRLARAGASGPARGWSFVHGMLRESLLRRARDGGRLPEYHRVCADMLSRRSGFGLPERLGRHLLEAGELERALEPLLRGADDRVVRGDYRGAENLLAEREEAMASVGIPDDDDRWGRAWVLRSQIHRMWSRMDQADAWATRALAAAGQYGWSVLGGYARLERGRVSLGRGETTRAWRRLRKAERVGARQADFRLMAEAQRAMAEVLLGRGDVERSAQMYRQAVGHFATVVEQISSDAMGIALCLRGLGEVARQAGDLDQASTYLDQSRDAFEAAGSRWGVANALNSIADLARLRGDLDAAEAGYTHAIELYDTLELGLGAVARANVGLVLIDRGRFGDARRILEQSLHAFKEMQMPPLSGTVHACILPCCAAIGDWNGFDRHLKRATSLLAEAKRVDLDIARTAQLAGEVARTAGETERAVAALHLARAQWLALDRHEEVEAVDLILAGTELSS